VDIRYHIPQKKYFRSLVFLGLGSSGRLIPQQEHLFSRNASIPMLIAAVSIIAIANIFALTNIQTYYATLYQGKAISPMNAMSVYAAVENISLAIGPVIFSYILANNSAAGMQLFSLGLVVCLGILLCFSVLYMQNTQKKRT
jgi:uncharacterized membrane protein SpoIIM required for sporulation